LKVEVRGGLYRLRVKLPPSNLLLISDRPEAVSAALASFTYHRASLEAYVAENPYYCYSLEPVEVERWAPEAVKLAAEAAFKAKVGPMAAVPGALAELALQAMAEQKAKVGVVENGGEIAAFTDRPLTVAVYAGNSPLSGRIGFVLSPEETPIGIATSSATVSHAINFGEADAAVALAESTALADAAAKAACNAVKGEIKASIRKGLEAALKVPGVRGALIVRGKFFGAAGRLPRLIALKGGVEEAFKSALKVL